VGGWNLRYRTNFEDMDLSRRLKQAGCTLIYEPLAWGRHLRQDRLDRVLRNCWGWWYPPKQDQGAYDSIAHAAVCLESNRNLAISMFNTSVQGNCFELTYPCFVLYYCWCLLDLQHVLRRGTGSPEAVSQTGLATFLISRHQLRNCEAIPGQVVERVLEDLKACARAFLCGLERSALESEITLEKLLPSTLATPEAVLEAIRRHLPGAEAGYLRAIAGQPYLSLFGAVHGAALRLSIQALEADEQEHGPAAPSRPGYVLFNPPTRSTPGGPNPPTKASLRWLAPSRIQMLAARLRARGGRVLIVDAAAANLDELEAHERVMGMEPVVVINSAAEGGVRRLADSARVKLRPTRCALGISFQLLCPSAPAAH
jgi:hypothetical protein